MAQINPKAGSPGKPNPNQGRKPVPSPRPISTQPGASAMQKRAKPPNKTTSTVRTAPPARRRSGPALVAASLQDLAAMGQHLRNMRAQAAALEQARREAEARAEAARNLFSRAVGAVQRLPEPNRADLPQDPPLPIPVQHQLDEQRALQESISDAFDASTLLDTDDALSYRRPGLGLDVTRKLRSGTWSIQRQLDLHGLRIDEAREALGQFIREAHRHGIRCVRVVHGKGLGSPGRNPVLKSRVQSWLVQKNQVLAFVQARPIEGGAGALVVLLQPSQGVSGTANRN